MRTDVKIFLTFLFLSLMAFSAIFLVFMPLIYEQRLLSFRLSLSYFLSFLYDMSLYFVFAGGLAVLVYYFAKSTRVEVQIFITVFSAFFWGIVGATMTASLYWGNSFPVHPLDPLGVITMWGDWKVILAFSILSLFILALSGLAVMTYEVCELLRKSAVKYRQRRPK